MLSATPGRSGMSRVRISSTISSAPRSLRRAQREVAAEVVQQFAEAAGAQVFETSARTGVGVAVRSLWLMLVTESSVASASTWMAKVPTILLPAHSCFARDCHKQVILKHM